MMNFQKPENALKRADELLAIGEDDAALQILHSAIGHKRFKSQGSDSVQEEIMMKHVRLCVQLQRLRLARDGLHQYRIITQHANNASLGKVITELRTCAEERLAQAKKNSANDESEDKAALDDLEIEESPDSLMLSTLQVDVQQNKEAHAALRFVWECYKMILDLLRTTPKLEKVYHETAKKVFTFCRDNERPIEFKRICEVIRNHYLLVMKNKHKAEFESLMRPDVHLDTRMTQLNIASELKLWRECASTAEDIYSLGIHDFFSKSLRSNIEPFPKSREKLMKWLAVYFEKMSNLLWVSDNLLFHALAWMRYMLHVKNFKKGVTESDLFEMSSIAVLAVLSIPLGNIQEKKIDDFSGGNDESTVIRLEHHRKMTALLGHPTIPTRNSLKYALTYKDVLSEASEDVRKLYNLLENNFTPLKLCTESQPILDRLEKEPPFAQYVLPLKKVIFHKLIVQLSKVYSCISVNYFTEHICPKNFFPWSDAEKVVVALAQQGHVKVRLDYQNKSISFASSSSMSPDGLSSLSSSAAQIRHQLDHLAKHLEIAVAKFIPGRSKDEKTEKEKFLKEIHQKLENEYVRIRQRNRENDQRRVEKQEEEMKASEERRRLEAAQKQDEERLERKRKEEALNKREEQRLKEEKYKAKSETAQQMLEEIKKIGGGAFGKQTKTKITIKGKQLDEINIEDVLEGNVNYEDLEKAQLQRLNKERSERIRQRKLEAKKMDHFFRACRQEELPVVEVHSKECLENDTNILLDLQNKHEEEHKINFNLALREKQVFEKIRGVKDEWVRVRMETREVEFERMSDEQHQRLTGVLKQRKLRRARERKVGELRRQRLELEKRRKEEEERRILEQLQKQQHYEDRRAKKLHDQAEKQRQRELEIEEKERQRRGLAPVRRSVSTAESGAAPRREEKRADVNEADGDLHANVPKVAVAGGDADAADHQGDDN